MQIYTGQTTNLFKACAINNSINKNRPKEECQTRPFIRTDIAAISPQGKSANLLANLLNQKELIQMNKDSLIKQTLEDESSAGAAGLKEQLEKYEEQMDKLDEQIAAEMAKQTEPEEEGDGFYQNPQGMDTPETIDDSALKLTRMSAKLESTQTISQAHIRREGEKRVCESEKELGSAAAEHKLEKIEKAKSLTGQVMPFVKSYYGNR